MEAEITMTVKKASQTIKISLVSSAKILLIVLIGLVVAEIIPTIFFSEEIRKFSKLIIGFIFFIIEMYFLWEWREKLNNQ